MSDSKGQADIMRKIAALMEKSEHNSNPNEAAAALAMAQKLAKQHQVDIETARKIAKGGTATIRDFTGDIVDLGRKGMPGWRQQLLNQIAYSNVCRTVVMFPDTARRKVTAAGGTYDDKRKYAEVLGERHNIEIVKFLYTIVDRQIRDMGVAAYAQSDTIDSWRVFFRSFCTAATLTVCARLQALARTTEEQSKELVLVDATTALEAYVADVYTLHKSRKHADPKSYDGFMAGKKAGEKVQFTAGLPDDGGA